MIQVTCPKGGTPAGCGHTFTADPDYEGFFDCPACGLFFQHDDHSASRRVDVLADEAPHLIAQQQEDPIDVAIDALEFRLEWLDDYGQREYGSDADDVAARYQQALYQLRGSRDEPRTILVHINVEMPPTAPATADDISAEITAALEVALNDPNAADNMPGLAASTWCIPLAEEI